MQQSIKVAETKEFVKVIAGLVQEGLTFKSHKEGGIWIIELTGGF
jgi:hypothetical protein